MVTPENALKGRAEAIPTAQTHFPNARPLKAAVPEGMEQAMFGMGCFGVSSGYSGRSTGFG